MLKLTESGSGFVHVVASQILALRRTDYNNRTQVMMPTYTFEVTETPEQIMAMPEMMRAMSPLVLVVPIATGIDWGKPDYPGPAIANNR